MHDVAVVILARAPEPGRAKTRLAAAVGRERAHEAYRRLLAITAAAVSRWRGPVLLASSGDHGAFKDTGLERLPQREQEGGPLGTRIAAAMAWGFDLAPKVLVIGSDCPGLGYAELRTVGVLLDQAAVALGPAEDGGFWAIGAADPMVASAVAQADVEWSVSTTLATLREHLTAHGFASALGPVLFDCDTAADLDRAVRIRLIPDHSSWDLRS